MTHELGGIFGGGVEFGWNHSSMRAGAGIRLESKFKTGGSRRIVVLLAVFWEEYTVVEGLVESSYVFAVRFISG